MGKSRGRRRQKAENQIEWSSSRLKFKYAAWLDRGRVTPRVASIRKELQAW